MAVVFPILPQGLISPDIFGLAKLDTGKSGGAASVIRTRDLTLTKGALYRWSYGSVAIDAPDLHEIARRLQAGFVRVSATA